MDKITPQEYISPGTSNNHPAQSSKHATIPLNIDQLKARQFHWPKPCAVVIRYINNPLTSGFAAVGSMLGGGVAGLIWNASTPHILAGIAIGGLTGGTCGSLANRTISLCSSLKQYILHTLPCLQSHSPNTRDIELRTLPPKNSADRALPEPSQTKVPLPEHETLLNCNPAQPKQENCKGKSTLVQAELVEHREAKH